MFSTGEPVEFLEAESVEPALKVKLSDRETSSDPSFTTAVTKETDEGQQQSKTRDSIISSPSVSRKRNAFSIDNIINGMDNSSESEDLLSPQAKKQKPTNIFDSIPSPPPKITDFHSRAVMGMPGFPAPIYNPFLLNHLATRTPASLPTASHRSSLGFIPMMPPFISPSLSSFHGPQSIL